MEKVRSRSRGLYWKIPAPTGYYEQPLYGRSGIKRTPLVHLFFSQKFTRLPCLLSAHKQRNEQQRKFKHSPRLRQRHDVSSGSVSGYSAVSCSAAQVFVAMLARRWGELIYVLAWALAHTLSLSFLLSFLRICAWMLSILIILTA